MCADDVFPVFGDRVQLRQVMLNLVMNGGKLMTQVGVFLSCLFSCLSLAFGQATSTLTGTVLDSSGAAVPGTAITVRNIGTGNERSVSSGEAGDYTVRFLAPGDYILIAAKSGFRQVKREGFGWR